MDARIKELAILSGGVLCEGYVSDPKTRNSIWTHGARVNTSEIDLEKFAKLLIKECNTRVEKYINDCGEIMSLPDYVLLSVYGIEE